MSTRDCRMSFVSLFFSASLFAAPVRGEAGKYEIITELAQRVGSGGVRGARPSWSDLRSRGSTVLGFVYDCCAEEPQKTIENLSRFAQWTVEKQFALV